MTKSIDCAFLLFGPATKEIVRIAIIEPAIFQCINTMLFMHLKVTLVNILE